MWPLDTRQMQHQMQLDAAADPHRACAAAPSLHCASAPSWRPPGWRPQRRGGCVPLQRHAPWLQQRSICSETGAEVTAAELQQFSCCACTWFMDATLAGRGRAAGPPCSDTGSTSGKPDADNFIRTGRTCGLYCCQPLRLQGQASDGDMLGHGVRQLFATAHLSWPAVQNAVTGQRPGSQPCTSRTPLCLDAVYE